MRELSVQDVAEKAYAVWCRLGRPWSRKRDGYGELWEIAGAHGGVFGRRRRVRVQIRAVEMGRISNLNLEA